MTSAPERDLPDGAQQRLVVLGLDMLGAVLASDPGTARARQLVAIAAVELDRRLAERARRLCPNLLKRSRGGRSRSRNPARR